MAMSLPSVTVMILNYQRREMLRRVVTSALQQDYPHLDILVVDNASTDDSVAFVQQTFPQVRVLPLPQNIGCAARNQGIAAAHGDIIVTIDNDVLLTTPQDVQSVVALFETHPDVACIDFQIRDEAGELCTRDWCHPRDWRRFAHEEFLTAYVLEGASAIRRQAFERVGGYWAPLFLGHEGHDLAYRLLGAGFNLLYTPRVQVTHLVSPAARPSSRIYYTFTRNAIWVSLRNHRPVAALRAIVKYMSLMAFSSVRAGQWQSYLQGIWDGLRGVPQALATRSPLTPAAYRRLRHIRRFEPGVLAKALRHWRERPI
ncbi:glycosyltransferase family 2 protein [Candidatus Entotheonella palauensis]|uniref:Glycosyltransferase 2-like domain-containing protein n=1 Tax=Candidatus Entotheonella gemina TaxID=1429439 RepID=W4MHJ6_9BACT|nr:glycosyltransferase [Candidatus Entotheonella palauensis]ETX09182.1 MAG: hypothetical protein ETSY2_01010 [Candidatus Entotheonella gemina]